MMAVVAGAAGAAPNVAWSQCRADLRYTSGTQSDRTSFLD